MIAIKKIYKYFCISFGCLIVGITLNLFLIPNQLAVGGISGLSTAINFLNGFPIGTLTFIINIPLLILGAIYEGKYFVLRTLYGTMAVSFFIDIFSFIPHITNDLLLSSVFGGILAGLGYGIVIRFGATTGGTDVIAKLLKKVFKHFSLGSIIFIIDILIIIFASFVFKNINTCLYSIISLYLSSKIIDLVVEGLNFVKLAIIVTSKEEVLQSQIISTLHRGATTINAFGAYSGKKKKIIICSLKQHEIPKLKNLILKYDSNAFLIITDSKEVYGEGFSHI